MQYDAVAVEKPRTRHPEKANLKSFKAFILYVKLNDSRTLTWHLSVAHLTKPYKPNSTVRAKHI